jgi:hypothetical protein
MENTIIFLRGKSRLDHPVHVLESPPLRQNGNAHKNEDADREQHEERIPEPALRRQFFPSMHGVDGDKRAERKKRMLEMIKWEAEEHSHADEYNDPERDLNIEENANRSHQGCVELSEFMFPQPPDEVLEHGKDEEKNDEPAKKRMSVKKEGKHAISYVKMYVMNMCLMEMTI